MLVVIGGLPGVGKTTLARAPAGRTGAPVHWVRLICNDRAENRRRVEERVADLPAVPVWTSVRRRAVDQWHERHTVVDTATGDPLAAVLAAISGYSPPATRSTAPVT